MVDSRLPGINKVRKRLADGNFRIYFYHRETGTRLKGKPGTSEFIASYAEAHRQPPDRQSGRCASLIRQFLASADFGALASATQAEYRRLLTVIERKFGSAPFAAMTDSRFGGDGLAWRDEVASKTPREADNRVVVFRRLLSWAKKRHLILVNVLEGYERVHRVDRSEMIWLPEHIAAIQKTTTPEIWAIFLVALHTGLRIGDIRRLPWSAYDGSALTLRISKRLKGSAGVLLRIPCTTALRALLDGLPRRGPLILTTRTGRAWQKRYVAHEFEKARAEAALIMPAIAELHFHDTRGTAITMLAEAGATVPEIASITGHSFRTVTSILERYLPRTRHLAEMAIAKLENMERTDFANRLQTGGPGMMKKDIK